MPVVVRYVGNVRDPASILVRDPRTGALVYLSDLVAQGRVRLGTPATSGTSATSGQVLNRGGPVAPTGICPNMRAAIASGRIPGHVMAALMAYRRSVAQRRSAHGSAQVANVGNCRQSPELRVRELGIQNPHLREISRRFFGLRNGGASGQTLPNLLVVPPSHQRRPNVPVSPKFRVEAIRKILGGDDPFSVQEVHDMTDAQLKFCLATEACLELVEGMEERKHALHYLLRFGPQKHLHRGDMLAEIGEGGTIFRMLEEYMEKSGHDDHAARLRHLQQQRKRKRCSSADDDVVFLDDNDEVELEPPPCIRQRLSTREDRRQIAERRFLRAHNYEDYLEEKDPMQFIRMRAVEETGVVLERGPGFDERRDGVSDEEEEAEEEPESEGEEEEEESGEEENGGEEEEEAPRVRCEPESYEVVYERARLELEAQNAPPEAWEALKEHVDELRARGLENTRLGSGLDLGLRTEASEDMPEAAAEQVEGEPDAVQAGDGTEGVEEEQTGEEVELEQIEQVDEKPEAEPADSEEDVEAGGEEEKIEDRTQGEESERGDQAVPQVGPEQESCEVLFEQARLDLQAQSPRAWEMMKEEVGRYCIPTQHSSGEDNLRIEALDGGLRIKATQDVPEVGLDHVEGELEDDQFKEGSVEVKEEPVEEGFLEVKEEPVEEESEQDYHAEESEREQAEEEAEAEQEAPQEGGEVEPDRPVALIVRREAQAVARRQRRMNQR